MSKKMKQALKELNSLIASGREFPDAEFKVSEKYKVTSEELRTTYDAQFN